jgi:hypothetical protein
MSFLLNPTRCVATRKEATAGIAATIQDAAAVVDDEVDRAIQMRRADGICTLLTMIDMEAGEPVNSDPVVPTVDAN